MASNQTDRRDGVIASKAIKNPVKAASTANLAALSGLLVIDGYQTVAGDRVLLKNQTTPTQNGIYNVAAGTWTRAKDCDGNLDLTQGTIVHALSGTVSAGLFYECTTTGTIVIGTSNLTWAVVSPSSPITLPIAVNQGGTGGATSVAGLASLGVVQVTAEGGTANAQTGTIDALVTAFRADQVFLFTPNVTNTGSATLTLTPSGGGALAAKTFKKITSGGKVNLVANDLITGCEYIVIYDGVDLVVIGVRPHSHGADIVAAATINLDTATGDCVDVTGNTGITAITLAEGEERTTRFTGTPTITNGASLVLLGGASQTMAAGDFAIWRGYAAGVVRQVHWGKASGGIVAAATQAQQEAGSTNDVAVTPGRQQFHPSAGKGWVKADFNGSGAASYNVSSITDAGAGLVTVNWAVSFSTANYAVVATVQLDAAGNSASTRTAQINNTTLAAGLAQVHCLKMSDFSGTDANYVHVIAFGDQ